MRLEDEIKKVLIDALSLEDITIDDIKDNESLFGNDGLGLDSIDALELGMALKKNFNITLSSNKEDNKQYFYSINALAELIRSQQNG
ncbi:acyl carrier protein [bacterium]|nr:acyl carrier protein [bacterium]